MRCVEVDGTVLGDGKIRKKLSWKYEEKTLIVVENKIVLCIRALLERLLAN